MKTHFFLRFVVLVALLAGVPADAVVRYDMTKAELLQELGKPTSVMKSPAGREVLLYPKGVRIELEKDRVVSVKGIDLAAAEQAETAAAEAKVTAAEDAKQKAAEEKQAAAEAAAQAKAEKEYADQAGKARLEMEKSVEAMEKTYTAPETRHRTARPFSVMEFLLEVAVKWALMIAALKLTTKYWNADVEWSGLLIAAGADTGVRSALALVAKLAFGVSSMFYLDEALSTIVLIFVLRKVSTNQSLNQAVTIAMTVKVFSTVVGSFLSVLILNALR